MSNTPTVRPASVLYWKGEVHTALVGSPDQIAARVREAVAYECHHEAETLFQCSSCDDITARVLATLGITTEARDG